jgi:hypothetical protein
MTAAPPPKPDVRSKRRLDPTKVPVALADGHRGGAPVIVQGRNSAEYGRTAYEQAVNDALEAVAFVARLGLDLTDVLPDRTTLITMLRATQTVKSQTADGKSFVNRYLLLDHRQTHGALVVISAGTGRKLDDTASQPYVAYLAELVRSTDAIALFGNRVDRMTRRAWALGPVMLQLSNRGGFIGDARYGIRTAEGIDSILTFFSAQAGEDEATKLPAQTRRGMRDATGTSLADGATPFGVTGVPPPGLHTYRSRHNGVIGPRILTFDTPACRPAPEVVAAGIPEVFDDAGNPVDQVANIRWFLRTVGTAGWSTRQLAQGLTQRRYSTEGIRRTHGVSATYDSSIAAEQPYRIIDTILRNLDVYETGTLTTELGVEGFDPIVITHVVPPDGPWATPEDFSRIRTWLATRARPKPRGITFAGHDVLIDGEECVFISRTPSKKLGQTEHRLAAVLRAPYRNDGDQLAPATTVVLPARLLPNLLAEALLAAGDKVLTLLPARETSEIDAPERAALNQAQARLRVLTDQRRTIEEQLLRSADDGRPVLRGALLEKANATYDQLAETDIPQALAAIHAIEATLEQRQKKRRESDRGAALDALLQLIASLRDPYDCSNVELLRQGVRNLCINATTLAAGKRRWTDYHISFEFHISEADRTIVLPITATHRHGSEFRPSSVAADALRELCARPTTFAELDLPARYTITGELAKILGLPARRLMLPNVTDPRLAHLAALALTADDLQVVAAATNEPLTLLERIRDLHRTTTRAVWRLHPSRVRISWYDHAAGGQVVGAKQLVPDHCPSWEAARSNHYTDPNSKEWVVVPTKGYTLLPCHHCGSHNRRPMLIPEVAGLLCLDCRLDHLGHAWPTDPYDHYIEQ